MHTKHGGFRFLGSGFRASDWISWISLFRQTPCMVPTDEFLDSKVSCCCLSRYVLLLDSLSNAKFFIKLLHTPIWQQKNFFNHYIEYTKR